MPRPSEKIAPEAGAKPTWLGNSTWQGPKLDIRAIKHWPSMTAVSYYRDAGETIMRSDRHRIFFTPDAVPSYAIQVEQGRMTPDRGLTSGEFSFHPAGLETRSIVPATGVFSVLWDKELYTALLPELTAAHPGSSISS